jgi:hypothetical protein
MLGRTNAGAELILHDVFGAIQYKGPGVLLQEVQDHSLYFNFRDLHHKT